MGIGSGNANKSLISGLTLLLVPAVWADDAALVLWQQGRQAEAIAGWQQDARAGDAQSAVFLGHIHRDGIGVPEDAKAAYEWFRLAAERGSPEAQYELGLMYEMGIGTGLDIGEATYWYGLAGTQACPTERDTEYLLQTPR